MTHSKTSQELQFPIWHAPVHTRFRHYIPAFGSGSSRSPVEQSPLKPRQIKQRTGCKPCKRRKVKCDEEQPHCRRCRVRGETCIGNVKPDQWQVECRGTASINDTPVMTSARTTTAIEMTTNTSTRINLVTSSAVIPAISNAELRYWLDQACCVMVLIPKAYNPLYESIFPYLHRSEALRHAIQSISRGHEAHSSRLDDVLLPALEERSLALSSLQRELAHAMRKPERTCSDSFHPILLTSLLLGVSSAWLVDKDDGFQFLLGVRHMLQGFLQRQEVADSIMRYVLGLYVYWEVTAPYIQSAQPSSPCAGLIKDLRTIVTRYLSDSVHPVLGLGSTIFPTLAEVGQHYRQMIEGHDCLMEAYEDSLEAQLLDWKVPEPAHRLPDTQPILRSLADAHRWTGIVMLYQAVSVRTKLTMERRNIMDRAIISVMETLRMIPMGSSYETAVPFFAVVVGSELRQQDLDYRAMLTTLEGRLKKSVRMRAYSDAFRQLSRLWERRDTGEKLTWLEFMYEEAYFPPVV